VTCLATKTRIVRGTMRALSLLISVVVLCACVLPGAVGSRGDRDDDGRVKSACREFGFPSDGWHVDDDCCAPKDQSACTKGYDHEIGNECWSSGDCMAYETICTMSDDPEKVTMSRDAVPYECQEDITGVIVFFAIIMPLSIGCCVAGCFFTKTCCFGYRRKRQFAMEVAPGVQMGGIPRFQAQNMAQHGYPTHPHAGGQQFHGHPPQYGGQPFYGRPAAQGYTVHQATIHPMAQPIPGQPVQGVPQVAQPLEDQGVVRFGRQSKVPMV